MYVIQVTEMGSARPAVALNPFLSPEKCHMFTHYIYKKDDSFLNKAMADINKMSAHEREYLRRQFERTMIIARNLLELMLSANATQKEHQDNQLTSLCLRVGLSILAS